MNTTQTNPEINEPLLKAYTVGGEPMKKGKYLKALFIFLFATIILIGATFTAFELGKLTQMSSNGNNTNTGTTVEDNTTPEEEEETAGAETPTPPAVPPSTSTLTTFTDPEIQNFSFEYDNTMWKVDTNEDLKFCNDVECGESQGRVVNLVSKEYSTDPDLLTLNITLSVQSSEEAQVDSNNVLCFDGHSEKISSDWFAGSNPYYYDYEAARKSWGRYFYTMSSVENDCIKGSYNFHIQPATKAVYKGQKIESVAIYLQDNVSEEMLSAANDIVKSIKLY